MSKLLRYFSPGQTVFVTSVTAERKPILLENEDLLVKAFERIFGAAQNRLIAWVIMPDHFHAIIVSADSEVPAIMKKVKLIFSYHYRTRNSLYRGTLWQSRYWDHVIRNEADLGKHIDYIHYNPVKHGLVRDPFLHPYSSAGKYLEDGLYQRDWGVIGAPKCEGEFGE